MDRNMASRVNDKGYPFGWFVGGGVIVVLVVVMAVLIYGAERMSRRQLQALCGIWEAVLPRGRLVVRQEGCRFVLLEETFSEGHIRRVGYELYGGSSPYYYCQGKRIYLWLSEDGEFLLQVPGYSYHKKRISNDQNHEKE